ncbi:MAG: hypothetical protein KGY66_01560 [Candidatus Thermoplasmatota archaeon]|nr:hypothetical protein [Candidatus Thermoplasmatota archaeon]
MDGEDLKLVKNIMEKVKKSGDPDTVLFDTPTTQIAKTNFFILKGLLELKGKKGYFVSLDRPHQNMSYLLQNHDISQENIWYIDAVSHMSGSKRIGKKNVEENVDFVDNTFQIEEFVEFFKEKGVKRKNFGSLEDIDFILIDNVFPILNYNNIEKIQEFLSSFEELIASHENLFGLIVMNSNSHDNLDRIIKRHVKTVIDVKKLKEDA